MSDPSELSAPRDPGSYGRPRRTGAGLWALIAFGVLCIAAGYGAARFGPDLVRAPPSAEPVSSMNAPGVPPPPAAATWREPAPTTRATPAASGGGEVSRLVERIEALEDEQDHMAEASAAALAAAALLEAAQTSRPFASELAALERVAPPSAELAALRPYAERGAPSPAALAASFPEYAARAAAAARAPAEGGGLLARLGHALSRVVTIRRVGESSGRGPDAVLGRAERQLEDGDVAAALATLEALPPDARAALAPWRARAEGRAMVDRRVSEVRRRALQDLSDLARGGG